MSDAELIEFASEFRWGVLNGRSSQDMCFAICWPLDGFLRFHRVKCELVEGETERGNHFWLALPDGRVLDPTADQFKGLGLPPVYLGQPLSIHRPTPPRTPDTK
jgi:hypothetical protein